MAMFIKADRVHCCRKQIELLEEGTILTTKLLLRTVSDYYILKAKAPTAKPFANICSIEEFFHILKSRPYLSSHAITIEKTLKLKGHIVLNNKISINSKRTAICIM